MSPRIVRVGRAATGLGLFAVKPIAAKAYIVTYRGKRIPTAEAHRRERAAAAKYMFEINRRWTIDGSSRRNLGRYINHACRPNCEAVLRQGQMIFRGAARHRAGRGDHARLRQGLFRSLHRAARLPLRGLRQQGGEDLWQARRRRGAKKR